LRVLDCDVEAPNAHLFLNPETRETKRFSVPVPEIDEGKCTYCKKCAQICRFRAIAILEEATLTFPELCHSCGGCMAVCPEDAISEIGRDVGEIAIGQAQNVDFIQGKLRVGEAMSPPLIKAVRDYEQPDILNIIDAPPGTSCPVVAAMKGADFILMVTEPTPFGLHDLKLAVGVVRVLGIPCGLVINQSDMGDDCVREYAETEKIPILMEIPFDRKIAQAYARGELLVEALPVWKARFSELYGKIDRLVEQGGQG